MAKRQPKTPGTKGTSVPTPPGRRRLDRRWLVGIVAAALVIVGGLVAASVLLNRSDSSTSGSTGAAAGATVQSGAEVQKLLAGIRQDGATLGKSDAPVTLVEYADPQCPYCAQFALDAFPGLVRDYIRPGKVKLVFRGVSIIGPDSVTGLQAIFAAGAQNKLWNLLEVVYENQGRENSGWLDDSFLRSAGAEVPGLDVQQMLDARKSSAVEQQMKSAVQSARDAGVQGTPSFEVGKTGGKLELFLPAALTEDAVAAKLDPLLGQ